MAARSLMVFSLVSTSQGVPEPISCLSHQFQDVKLEQPSSATDSIPPPHWLLDPWTEGRHGSHCNCTWKSSSAEATPQSYRESRDQRHQEDLKDTGVVILITFPLNSTLWPARKTAGSWRLIVAYCKFIQMVISTAAAALAVTEQTNASPAPDMHLLIWKMLCSQSLLIRTTSRRLLSPGKVSSTPSYLRATSTLQPWVTVQYPGTSITFLFLKTPHWSITSMMLC